MKGVVIDLASRRAGADRPAPEFVMVDDSGREMRLHSISYRMADRWWSCQLWAYSMKDAEARVQAMRETLHLDGELHAAGTIAINLDFNDNDSVEP